jgi:acyl-CoA hydrolase/ribosomal protein S18 acetylase RimI-like enzyme
MKAASGDIMQRRTGSTGWIDRYPDKVCRAADAIGRIGRGQRVFIGSGCAQPQKLTEALAQEGRRLADTQILHILTLGTAPYTDALLDEHFRHNAYFIGPNTREAVAEGRADYTPIFLSEIPRLFRRGTVPIDVALIQVSPPDRHGYCSYGVSVDIVKAATECARLVFAEVNPRMPRTHGDSFVHVSRLDGMIPVDMPLLESTHGEPDDVARRIGRHIANLIDDGSTLQMGIGTIPDAVLANLGGKKDLGVHTEMFTEGIIELVERGVVNGSRKTLHPGKIVASFVMGTRRLFDFVDDNPMCEFHPTEYTNDPFIIARNHKMVSINSALQVDLTGQVCADSIGEYFYSGIGGQVDFVRGASRSEGGKPIIALPATAQDGKVSRIVTALYPGAGVVTSRGDVHWVVTEWGVANLHGKTVRERALALVHIAHPDFREELMEEAHRRHLIPPEQAVAARAGSPELYACESDYELKDGRRLHIRPIEPSDGDMLRDLFYALSPETVMHRFMHALKRLPPAQIRQFVTLDYAEQLALVAIEHEEAPERETQRIIAVARYAVDPATGAAEVAFVVREDWQGQGLGMHLFRELIRVGRDRGIRKFTADVMADNRAMINLFHACAPGEVKTTLRDDVYHLSFEFEPGPNPAQP